MKLKLDENLGTRTQRLLRAAGHEVRTIRDQGLEGCSDQDLYGVCCAEPYCLVTLDLDFTDVTRFAPTQAGGIVVIRVPRNPSLALLEQLVRRFLRVLTQVPVANNLWIIEIGRIRIHQSETKEEP